MKKRRRLWWFAAALMVALLVAWWSGPAAPPGPGVSLTFLSYTNQTHSNEMAEVTFAVAVLQITNSGPTPVKVLTSAPRDLSQKLRESPVMGSGFQFADLRLVPAELNPGASAIIHVPMYQSTGPWETEVALQRWGRTERWSAAVMSALPGSLRSALADYRQSAPLTKVSFGPETNLPPQPIVRFPDGSPFAKLVSPVFTAPMLGRLPTNVIPLRWQPSPDIIDGLRFDRRRRRGAGRWPAASVMSRARCPWVAP